MLFNSVAFIIFFILVTAGYFILPHRFRWALLLLASAYFYAAFIPWYLLILVFLILVDFFLGLQIEKAKGARRKHLLYVSILSNVGTLFIFKYYNFFVNNFEAIAAALHWSLPIAVLKLALPIGLSFHTFQSLSYVIEVYQGKYPAEKHLGIYALYVMFFPQLVAGPIERPEHMLPQFRLEHTFEWNRFWLGVQRMILGFFKKIIIADQLAVYVNGVYGAPHNYGTVSLVVATVFFAWQIYCDFSGYCDIAIGAAQVLGFSLSENFQAPYTSATISEFWRRWHISLSNWFRDYVYIPLGGSRGSEFATARNLFLTFLLSGLWHGANWTYVVWGAVNGVYLIIGRLLHRVTAASFTAKQLLPFAILRTFILTSFAWIFFRASSLAQAGQVIEGIVYRWDGFDWRNFLLGQTSTQLAVVVISIAVLFGLEYLGRDSKKSNQFLEKKLWLRSAVYLSVLFLMMALWRGVGSEFIYFQF